MFSIGDRSGNLADKARLAIEFSVHRGNSDHDGQHVILHYIVGRGCLAVLDDSVQLLVVRCPKYSNLHSNN
ncbi:hypothetical protein TNCV_4720321 [Trichonephila clavipes]|uniref:Uncharacterized protein n=1 Tax=Trichonephila clavipes TaxID=2585209 RepID=A0A8X6W739_TRICX|nr:hypothetical protein TNCV_4720321 [Trichonephila clavipes]